LKRKSVTNFGGIVDEDGEDEDVTDFSSTSDGHDLSWINSEIDKASPLKKRGRRQRSVVMTDSMFSLLLNLLGSVQGKEFGGAFLGTYLGFRDALAVARTCKLAYECMMGTQSFLSSYILQILARFTTASRVAEDNSLSWKVIQDFTQYQMYCSNDWVIEYNHMNRLPLMQLLSQRTEENDKILSFLNYQYVCRQLFERRLRQPSLLSSVDALSESKNAFVDIIGRRLKEEDILTQAMDEKEEAEKEAEKAEEAREKKSSLNFAWDLSLAVEHLKLASEVLDHHQEQLLLEDYHRPDVDLWLEKCAPLPAMGTKTRAKKLKPKIRAAPWPRSLAVILVSWALRRGIPIGTWKPGAWMHSVLKFLVHAIDLDSSIWSRYLQDPRYLDYYRSVYFDSTQLLKNPPGVDFWLLINDMCSSVAYKNCALTDTRALSPYSLHSLESRVVFPCSGSHAGFFTSGSNVPSLSKNSCRPLDCSSFQTFYHQHLHLAENLSADIETPYFLKDLGIDNISAFEALSQNPILKLPDHTHAYVEFFAPLHMNDGLRFSLVVWSGAVFNSPTLVMTMKKSAQPGGKFLCYLSKSGFESWWPLIMDQYQSI
jgi:hypothetical protein